MIRESVQAWLDAYLAAWRSNDAEAIGALFAPEASYAYEPYGEPLQGRAAIVASWLSEPDEPGSWEAAYFVALVEGPRAVATGESRYASGKVYSNLFQLEFDDEGRCTRFVEWYMEQPT